MATLSDKYSEQCKLLNVKVDSGIAEIMGVSDPDRIQRLDFSAHFVSTTGMQGILETIRDCSKLESVSFENTYMRNESIPTLVSVVKTLPSLTSINLSNNSTLGFSAAQLLLQMVKSVPNLLELDLKGTAIEPYTQDLIQRYLNDNAVRWQTLNKRDLPVQKQAPRSVPVQPTSPSTTQSPRRPDMNNTVQRQSPLQKQYTPSNGTAPPSYNKSTTPNGTRTSADNAPAANGDSVSLPPIAKKSTTEPLLDSNRFMYTAQTRAANTDLAYKATPNVQCEQLRIAVIDEEEKLVHFIKDYIPKVEVKREEHTVKMDRATSLAQEYLNTTQSIDQSTFTDAELVNELNLINSNERLLDLHGQYIPRPGTEIDDQCCVIVQKTMKTEKGRQMTHENIEKTVACLDYDIRGTKNKLDHIATHNPVTVQSVLSELYSTDDRVRSLCRQIENNEQAKQLALQDDDMHKAEACVDELVRIRTELLSVMKERLAILRSPGSELELLTNLDDDKTRVQHKLTAHKDRCNSAITSLQQDIGVLESAKVEKQKQLTVLQEDFRQQELRISHDLYTNTQRQAAIWVQIMDMFGQLDTLGDQRKGIVDRYLTDRTVFERKKGDIEHWVDVAAKHQARIENVLGELPDHLDLYHNVELYTKEAVRVITDHIDEVKRRVNDQLFQERGEYLKVFREHYLTINELLTKKEERVSEINSMIDQNEFQLQLVRQSFDPNAPMYKTQIMELQKVRGAIQTKLDTLREIADSSVIDFDVVGEELLASGVQFTHPVIEAQERNVQEKEKAMHMRMDYNERQSYKNKEEFDQVHTMQTAAKQARMSGMKQLIPPLSPKRSTGSAGSGAGTATVTKSYEKDTISIQSSSYKRTY